MFRVSDSSPLRAIHFGVDRSTPIPEVDDPDLSNSHDYGQVVDQPFKLPAGLEDRLVAITDPGSIGAELLRTLAVRLRQVRKRFGIRKLLVTSAVPGEGKTVVSANLAITLSLHHHRVLLFDGDLRRASLSRWFAIADDSFGSSWNKPGNRHLPSLRKAEGLPLWVVPAGMPVEMPGDVFQSPEFAEALSAVEKDFDWILFDSPPLIPFGDATILASLADAVVVVTRKGVTPRNELTESLKLFDPSKLVATVLNCAEVTSYKYYHDYYAHIRATPRLPGRASGPIIASENSDPPVRHS